MRLLRIVANLLHVKLLIQIILKTMSQIQTNTWLPIDWGNAKNQEFIVIASGSWGVNFITYYNQAWRYCYSGEIVSEGVLKDTIHYMIPEAPQQ